MGHLSEGVLRRLVDEPSGVTIAERDHVAACDACLRLLEGVRNDASAAQAALAISRNDDVDVDAAWHRLAASTASAPPASPPADQTLSPPRPMHSLLRRPVAAGVAVALVLAGVGTAAANDWLPIFRAERVEAVEFAAGDLNALPDLAAYGDVEFNGEPDVRRVPDAKTAEAESGLDVPVVDELPRGVSGEPIYQVGNQVRLTFTFDADRAAQTAAAAGEPLPAPPPGLDGSQVELVAGPGVAAIWTKNGVPSLAVGRATAPSAFSTSGLPFETLRDYLLSLPGLPEDVAGPLRTFDSDGTTLPIPVPTDRFSTSTASVDGQTATVLVTNDRSLAAVAWVDSGLLTVIVGSLDADEVLSVARGLG